MRVEIKEQSDYCSIKMRNDKTPIIMLIFFLILLISSLITLGMVILELISENTFIGFYFFIAFICWAAYKTIFAFLYILIGDETIEIHYDYLIHKKQIWKIRQIDKYKKAKIRDIKIYDRTKSLESKTSAIFGLSDIFIKVKYGIKTRLLGKEIDRKLAERIIYLLIDYKYLD